MRFPNEIALGQGGSAYVTSGAVTIPSGKTAVMIYTTASTTITDSDATVSDTGFADLKGVTIAADRMIYGRWSKLSVSGGAVVYFA